MGLAPAPQGSGEDSGSEEVRAPPGLFKINFLASDIKMKPAGWPSSPRSEAILGVAPEAASSTVFAFWKATFEEWPELTSSQAWPKALIHSCSVACSGSAALLPATLPPNELCCSEPAASQRKVRRSPCFVVMTKPSSKTSTSSMSAVEIILSSEPCVAVTCTRPGRSSTMEDLGRSRPVATENVPLTAMPVDSLATMGGLSADLGRCASFSTGDFTACCLGLDCDWPCCAGDLGPLLCHVGTFRCGEACCLVAWCFVGCCLGV
mmetsp:Transcript_138821/g.346108  ORF Transcript_138821/g.346108 Transcript_138821/m.346108 type:complete len:264 (-) Transcript_138821:1445-2236(-)